MSAVMASRSTRSRTVMSPAGEPISVISNEDWAETSGVPLSSVTKVFRQKICLLYPLWKHGPITEASGRATMVLYGQAQAVGYTAQLTAIPGLFIDPLNALSIERQTKGKRTYKIQLVALPERWLDLLHEMDATIAQEQATEHQEQADREEAVAAELRIGLAAEPYQAIPVDPDSKRALEVQSISEPLEVEQESIPTVEPLDDSVSYLEVAPTVAMALLTQVVEIISAGDPHLTDRRIKQLERDMSEQGARLAQRLAENDSLRRQVREAGDQIIALKHERDGIFKRLRIAEHNLEQASNVDTERIVRMRVEQEISKLMQLKPGSSKGPDDA